ncbi:MAG: App1 family protein [Myxococcaceae bacterium]
MPSPLIRAAHASRLRWTLFRRKTLASWNRAPPLRVVPFRGYGTPRRALVKARVLENRFAPERGERTSLWDTVVSSYKRYATRPIPFVSVRVKWGGHSELITSDEEGFVDAWVTPPPGLEGGWHKVRLEIEGVPGEGADAGVLVVSPQADMGIISDIDDTVIVTGVTNLLKRAKALFLTEARTRLPFEGVTAFYAALRDGKSGSANNPIFYVSSSPWNLFEHLEEFFDIHDVPRGVLLLRDWGLSRHGFAPGGGHGHKLNHIRSVMEGFPSLRFILIGDSGQQDAQHYLTAVREHPGRIAGVYIRNVSKGTERAEQLAEIGVQMMALGTELLVVDDSVSAARHAASKGWIRWEEIQEVREKKKEDLAATSLVDIVEGHLPSKD